MLLLSPIVKTSLCKKNRANHNKIIDRLITVGSLLPEAEQVKAFNKALKEFKM
jgi:hypothetical protein